MVLLVKLLLFFFLPDHITPDFRFSRRRW